MSEPREVEDSEGDEVVDIERVEDREEDGMKVLSRFYIYSYHIYVKKYK